MDAPLSGSESKTAAAVCTLSIVLLVGTITLSRSLQSNSIHYNDLSKWYSLLGTQQSRIEEYYARSSRLYEDILDADYRYPFESIPYFSKQWLAMHRDDTAQFASIAKETVDRVPSPLREQILEDNLIELFDDGPQRQLIRSKLKLIASIDQHDSWNEIVYLLIYEGLRPPGIFGNNNTPPVSYGDRYPNRWTMNDEATYLERSLVEADDLQVATKAIDDAKALARAELRSYSSEKPTLSIPGISGGLSVADLIMLGGPLMVWMQMMYFVQRCQRMSAGRDPSNRERRKQTQLSLFPQFESPNDPCFKIRWTFVELVQRLLWSTFLLIPLVVLSFGVMYRYDLSGARYDGPGLQRIAYTFSYDLVSVIMDWVNLICFGISLLVTVRLAATRRIVQQARKSSAVLCGLACALVMSVYFVVKLNTLYWIDWRMVILVAPALMYGCLWAGSLWQSVMHRSTFMTGMSVAAIIIFVYITM